MTTELPADWTPARTETMCRAILAEAAGPATPADPAHDDQHLSRVLHSARVLAAEEGAHDELVLTAAALLHDLVNLPKDHPERSQASRLSASAAAKALRAHGFPPDRIESVAHAIEAHSFSAAIAPRTPEARALQDADRLDALGAIGLARMFVVAGRLGRPLYDPQDILAQRRAPDDSAYALDHLETKLFLLPDQMQTRAGRLRARERVEWMESFRTRLLTEI